MNVVYSVACPSGPVPATTPLATHGPAPPPAQHSNVIIVASAFPFTLIFSLRAFLSLPCAWVSVSISRCVCVSLGYAKASCTTPQSGSGIPRNPRVVLELGVFQFDMLDRFSLISSAAQHSVVSIASRRRCCYCFSALRLSSPIYRIFTLILR